MNYYIVHLSDLHIGPEKKKFLDNYVERIHSSVNAKCNPNSSIIFVTTGDIINRGVKESYDLAFDLFENLSTMLKKTKMKCHFVKIPGNHDCDFAKENGVRSTLLKALEMNSTSIDNSIIDNITSIQDDYFNFHSKLIEDRKGNKVFWSQSITIGTANIVFNCLNTAWCSSVDESKARYGRLYYPVDNLKLLSGDITVSLMHHPYNWYTDSNRRNIKQSLEQVSDLILTGHEHEHETSLKETASSQTFYSASRNSFDDYGNLRFTLYDISIDHQGEKNISSYFYNKDRFENEVEFSSIKDNSHKKYKYSLNSQSYDLLNKLTSKIMHTEKDEVLLNEIFVEPEFKVNMTTVDDSEDESREEVASVIGFKKLNEELLKSNCSLILGSQHYGKTTIGKKIFLNMLEQGKMVVFTSYDEVKINSAGVYSSFSKYCKNSYNDKTFESVPVFDRVLIVDNVDLLTCKVMRLIEIVKEWKDKFHAIIFLGDENLSLALTQMREVFTDIYEMKKFSKRQSISLIRNWVNTFKIEALEEREVRVKKLFKLVNQALDIGLIPNNPFYITIYLAQINALGEKIESITSCAQLVERMIQTYHSNLTYKDIDNSGVLNFIQELSWSIYKIDERKMDLKQYSNFVEVYCKKYGLKINSSEMLSYLAQKKVLKQSFDEIKFSEDYFLFYYTAKYIRKNYSADDLVKKEVEVLVSSCHRTDYSSIILFLSYLMEENLIFKMVRDKLNSLLSKRKSSDLKLDLKDYLHDVPDLLMKKEGDSVKSLSYDEIAKKVEERKSDEKDIVDHHSGDENFEFAVAYRGVQLLGSMLQNSSTKMIHSDKMEILLDNLNLASRLIDDFVNKHIDLQVFEAAKFLKKILMRKNKDLSDQDFLLKTKSMIVRIIQFIVVNIVEKISNHSANRTLLPVYSEILKDDNYFHNVIDLQLKLDHHDDHLEFAKISEYSKKFNNDIFLKGICTDVVRKFLQTTSEEMHVRQKIAASFNIPYKSIPVNPSGNVEKKNV